jgi:hypothetical protein
MWQTVIKKAVARRTEVQIANQALAELPTVTALRTLEANRHPVDPLIGRRWIAMQDAREEGAAWDRLRRTGTDVESPDEGSTSLGRNSIGLVTNCGVCPDKTKVFGAGEQI